MEFKSESVNLLLAFTRTYQVILFFFKVNMDFQMLLLSSVGLNWKHWQNSKVETLMGIWKETEKQCF